MVGKRARKCDDTDSDLSEDISEDEEPAPKKYSLRQRKQPLFADEFEYYIEENEREQSVDSSDEDFNLDDTDDISIPVSDDNELQPEIECSQGSTNDLIDFEDIIRADVVNKQTKIDYDNVIHKSLIKIPPIIPPLTKKRGRKQIRNFLKTRIVSKASTQKEDDILEYKTDKEQIGFKNFLRNQINGNSTTSETHL